MSPLQIAEKLIDLCLKRGSTDNMSAIIVLFDDGISKVRCDPVVMLFRLVYPPNFVILHK